MGSHRKPDELKSEIVRGTINIIATGGMENFSFPKLTACTGISAPTVYEHYKNKEELLTTCFITIDREISNCIEKAIAKLRPEIKRGENTEFCCRFVWEAYRNYLISNAEKTIFYRHFFNSNYYTREIQALHRNNFGMLRDFIEISQKNDSGRIKCNTDLLKAHIINATAAYASKVLRGYYEDGESTQETVYNMVFQPIYAALGLQNDDTDDPEFYENT